MDKKQFRILLATLIITILIAVGGGMVGATWLTYNMIKEDAKRAAAATKEKAVDMKEKGVEVAKNLIENYKEKHKKTESPGSPTAGGD